MDTREQPSLTIEARAYPIPEPRNNILGFASATIGGVFAVNNLRVINSEKGLFVAMPQQKDAKGEYRDICFPVTKEFREQLIGAVMDAYYDALEKASQEKASVRGQIQEGKAAQEAPVAAKAKSAKGKTEPER